MADWPHVTAVIGAAHLVDTAHFTDDARERGTAVHLACQYLDQDDLDESSLADDVAPRVASYKKFLAEMRPVIIAIEQTVEHPTLRYCGRLDRIVEINGRRGVLDLKGPWMSPTFGMQCEAYRRCLNPMPPARWTLHLSDDGYRLIEHTDRDDWPAFHAALTLYNWKRNHSCLTSS
jgi:hypothetical protein